MSRRKATRGACVFCKNTYAKSGMSRHLQACKARKEVIAAEQGRRGRTTRLFHLVVQGTYATDYWLHLEAPASATLANLDQFLRDIWLECCGHLSAFTIENTRYELDTGGIDAMWTMFFGPASPPKSMDVPLGSVLRPKLEFSHEYDFGSTTNLTLRVVSEREGLAPKKESVKILAQNDPPDYRCGLCGKPAAWVDVFEDYALLCKDCDETEGYGDGLMPIVNSPRVGVCGYTGDAWD